MLKRKVYNNLIEWKSNQNKRALMILGARQVVILMKTIMLLPDIM